MEKLSTPSEEVSTLLFNSSEVKDLAREDMDFFAGLVCPDDMTLAFPPLYLYLWNSVVSAMQKDRDFSKFALGLPRGHGKTMVVKLLIVFAILFTKKRYILVVGANSKKAEAIISDVVDMLDSTNVQEVFGNWRYGQEKDSQDLKKFIFNGRPIILEAAGQGTAIRGNQQKNSRPDFMIFDDAQTAAGAASIVESESFRRWFLGDALKAKSPTGCTYIYIGNMYKDLEISDGSKVYTCMLRNLQRSSSWTSFIVGAILQDFTAIWEELQPLEQLLEEYRQDLELGQPEIFFSEVLNDPQATSSFFLDTAKVVRKEKEEGELHQGNYIVIDPATSKATPDQIAVGYFEIFDGIPNAAEVHTGKWTAPQLIDFVLKLAIAKNCTLICPEANAYQYSLVEWFAHYLQQLGLTQVNIQPIYNTSRSKSSRILKFFRSLMAGEMTTSPQSHSKIITQGATFNPRVLNNVDDILDLCAMALQVPVKWPHLIDIPGNLYRNDLNLGLTQSEAPPELSF